MTKRTQTQKEKKNRKKWPVLQRELTVYDSNPLATLPNNEQARQRESLYFSDRASKCGIRSSEL